MGRRGATWGDVGRRGNPEPIRTPIGRRSATEVGRISRFGRTFGLHFTFSVGFRLMPSTEPKNRPKVGVKMHRRTDGFYVHSNPPKVFQARRHQVSKLENLSELEEMVLRGRGQQLIGQYSSNPKIRKFLDQVPEYINKINEAHEATINNDLVTLQKLNKDKTVNGRTGKNVFLSTNREGVGLLHKAAHHGLLKIVQFLVSNHPEVLNMKDVEGRTALHYCGSSEESKKVWQTLVNAGADPGILDLSGNPPSHYAERDNEISLPSEKVPFDGFFGYGNGELNDIPIKASYIRIWIHDRDIKKLQKLIWEGYGGKLLMETSNNPRIKRFLDGVPHVLNGIKEVHSAVINDDFEEFIKKTSHPVPTDILGSKDVNGLNPLHKAAGLGRLAIAKNIVERNKNLVLSVDRENRTPLHFAAASSKIDDSTYNFLISENADESALDNRGKLPGYYKNNSKEILKYLKVVPEAPRTPQTFQPRWDWATMRSEECSPTKKDPKQSLISLSENLGQKNGTKNVNCKNNDTNDQKIEKVTQNQPMALPLTKTTVEQIEPEAGKRCQNQADLKQENSEGDFEINNFTTAKNIECECKDVIKERDLNDECSQVWTNKNFVLQFSKDCEDCEDCEDFEDDENDDLKKSPTKITETILKSAEKEIKSLNTENKDIDVEKQEILEEKEPNNNESLNKTIWEIGEERQRLLDEGLVKIVDEDESDEADKGNNCDGVRNCDLDSDGKDHDDNDDGINNNYKSGDDDDDYDDNNNHNNNNNNNNVDDEDDVQQKIESGDMKELASLVLDGKGTKLLGKFSKNAEVQAFLENVPFYMDKIATVHKAARAGSLKMLQTALDRRKFAGAKESLEEMEIGVTPLHSAVLYQRPQIVKYLGGRFPETLDFKDELGRTPLHYAAVLPDGGHTFNILLNFGANRKVTDNNGLTPSQYLENPQVLTYEKLLEECKAPVRMAKDILCGQDSALFGLEGGTYLAEALGGPLIKGLIAVANERPENPIAYLANFLCDFNGNNEREKTAENAPQHLTNQIRVTDCENNPKKQTGESSTEGNGHVFDDKEAEEWEEEPQQSPLAITERDEFGQSILHFAAARAQGRVGLFQLIQESGANLGCRDELYRTARDVAAQANLRRNMNEIDQYVISLAARGDLPKIKALYLEGYDHIIDLKDDDSENIIEIASNKNQERTAAFLKAIPTLETRREQMHEAIREGNLNAVHSIIEESKNGRLAVIGKNTSGRCSLHIAVLCQQKEITELLAQKYPETLKIGDNLERTAMHYAMGVNEVETLSKILIKNGAQRILKDLKGRQPTYYFINRSDITKLQREECS